MPTYETKNKKHQKGFTLLELLVVFAIIALITSITPIAFNKIDEGAKWRAAISQAHQQMRAARQLAIQQGSPSRFIVNTKERRFGIEGQDQTYQLPMPLQMSATMAEQEKNGEQMAIKFLPDGGATGGSLEIQRPTGQKTRLTVDWFTGRITQE